MPLQEPIRHQCETAVNADPAADSEMSLYRRSLIFEPQDTKAIIRNLILFDDDSHLSHSDDLPDICPKQQFVVRILIGVLGALSAMAFYLLWLKACD